MGLLEKLFGICDTPKLADESCWQFNDGELVIDLSRAKEISADGSALRLQGGDLPDRVLLVCVAADRFFAYVNRCTHSQIRRDLLPWTSHVPDIQALTPQIRCRRRVRVQSAGEPAEERLRYRSMGQAEFDLGGKLLKGGGKGPLPRLSLEKDGERLRISMPG